MDIQVGELNVHFSVNGGGKVGHMGGPIVGLRLSKSRGDVRLSVQHKCHSVMLGWYQMTTLRKPPGIVALENPRHPGLS